MYTTPANIAAKLGTSLTDAQASYFSDVLEYGIDTVIDRLTGTTFGGSDPATIYVSGSGSSMLVIPTMHSITSVAKVNDDGTTTAIAVDTYRTYPQGETNKYALKMLNNCWSDGFENYAITGILGFAEVPADIVEIATEYAVNALNSNINNIRNESVGDWSVRYADSGNILSNDSMITLNSYRRLSRSI